MDSLRIAKLLLLGSGSLLLLASTSVVVQVSEQIHRAPDLLLKVEATVDYAGRAARNVEKASGVWEKASQTEADYLKNTLPPLTKEVQQNLVSANNTVVHLGDTAEATQTAVTQMGVQTTATLQQAQTFLQHTDPTVQSLLATGNQVFLHTDQLVTDPHLLNSVRNLDTTSKSLADSMEQTDAILKDGRKVADKYVAPQKWYMKVMGYALHGGELTWDFMR